MASPMHESSRSAPDLESAGEVEMSSPSTRASEISFSRVFSKSKRAKGSADDEGNEPCCTRFLQVAHIILLVPVAGVVLLGPFAVAVWGLVLSVETQQRDDDVDASVAGSLWILGVLGASMFALLFVAGLCYYICVDDEDACKPGCCEDEDEDRPHFLCDLRSLFLMFSIIGLAVACLCYAIIGFEASLDTDDEFGSSFDVRLVTLACLVGFGAWSCVSCVGFWYGLLGLQLLFGSND